MIVCSGASAPEKRLMKRVEAAVYKRLGQRDIFVVDMTVTDEATIQELNKSARGVDAVTDVLSFPYLSDLKLPVTRDIFPDEAFDGRSVMLGSIMICRARAEEQAESYGHSYRRELGFLTCHGLLHLLGFDHVKEEDEKIMFPLQKEIMALAKLKATE